MTPERIAEIAHSYADYCVESDFMRIKKGIQDAIQEAIDIVSKTWKYPGKGELPEKERKIYFIVDTFTPDHIGKRCGLVNDYFWCQIQRRSYEINEVKAWTYAPMLED